MVWLIGNKGMLGSDVETLLQRNKISYIASDIEVDITNIKNLYRFLKKNNISGLEYIINCSAYTAVDKSETEKELAYKINCTGVSNIAEAAEKMKADLIHISTDYVYNGEKKEEYLENDNTNPLGVYGWSKLEGELKIINTINNYYIIRTSWLYGKNGKNFVTTMLKLFKERNEVSVVSDQFGSPTYSKDLADVIINIIQHKDSKIDYGIYHFTNEGKTNWYDFTLEIKKIAEKKGITINKELNIKPVSTKEYPTPAKRPKYSVLSKLKIKKKLGIKIRDWKKALEEYINLEIK